VMRRWSPILIGLCLVAATRLCAAETGPELAAPDLVVRCTAALREWRIEDARRDADELLEAHADSAIAQAMAAHVAFMEGEYEACRRRLAKLKKMGAAAPELISEMMEKLEPVHDEFQERRSEHFRLRWSHPADAVLAEYAMPVLEKALERESKALGHEHEGSAVVVEIYPDIESFAAASTLDMEDIERSGAAGICQFNRVMLVSPRHYVQGFRWCDALAHELAHYVVIKKTGNRIPVWLHEGIAKHCEQLWRREEGTPLNAIYAALLAEAQQSDRLVTFEQMHPSLVKLDTQEQVALAYAEAIVFVQFLEAEFGKGTLGKVLNRVAGGDELGAAFDAVTAMPFEDLRARWLAWLKARKLERIPGLRLLPRVVSDGASNEEQTGHLSGVLPEEAFRFLRLGDMLVQEAEPVGAAVEYRKAADRAGFISPHLHVRLARALAEGGGADEALRTLDEVALYYEDYLPTYIVRGELHLGKGEAAKAIAALEEAVQINPYDPRPHELLAGLYAEGGQAEKRAREERALRIIYKWLGM